MRIVIKHKHYVEYWKNTSEYYSLAKGTQLRLLAATIGKQRPEDDPLAQFTWKVPRASY